MQEEELRQFLDTIWGRDTCAVRMASRNRDLRFRQVLYPWPANEKDVIDFITGNHAAGSEVYFSPDLYKPEAIALGRASKDLVLGSRVICLDFDGNAPDSNVWDETGIHEGLPIPSIIIQSSEVDNQHMYWVLDEFITDVALLENMRRAITYKLKADGSGWDAGQLLRPPFTTNYGYVKKRDKTYDVIIERSTDRVYPASQFAPPKDFAPLLSTTIDLDTLPTVERILLNGSFVEGFENLFFKSLKDLASGDRSGALMAVAYYAAESDLSDTEIYALVQDADTRWGKYVGRGDRPQRISDIVARARTKYPHGHIEIGFNFDGEAAEQPTPTVFSFKEMLEAPFDIEWFIDKLLSRTGYGLFVGAPGVGKTQLLIRLGVAVALGKEFLKWPVTIGPQRVMLFALEMYGEGVKNFLSNMTDLHDAETLEKLHENFFIYPQNREIYLDTKAGRDVFERYLEEFKPSLVFIDSLSKAVLGSLNEDKAVRPVSAYLDQVRRKYKCAIIVVHHGKKKQPSDPGAQDADTDYVYGSRFITTDADFVLGFQHAGRDQIEVSYSKVRYGPTLEPFTIERDKNMNFTKISLARIPTRTTKRSGLRDNLMENFYNVPDASTDGESGSESTPKNPFSF